MEAITGSDWKWPVAEVQDEKSLHMLAYTLGTV
jgi:hypothetical protein